MLSVEGGKEGGELTERIPIFIVNSFMNFEPKNKIQEKFACKNLQKVIYFSLAEFCNQSTNPRLILYFFWKKLEISQKQTKFSHGKLIMNLPKSFRKCLVTYKTLQNFHAFHLGLVSSNQLESDKFSVNFIKLAGISNILIGKLKSLRSLYFIQVRETLFRSAAE